MEKDKENYLKSLMNNNIPIEIVILNKDLNPLNVLLGIKNDKLKFYFENSEVSINELLIEPIIALTQEDYIQLLSDSKIFFLKEDYINLIEERAETFLNEAISSSKKNPLLLRYNNDKITIYPAGENDFWFIENEEDYNLFSKEYLKDIFISNNALTKI